MNEKVDDDTVEIIFRSTSPPPRTKRKSGVEEDLKFEERINAAPSRECSEIPLEGYNVVVELGRASDIVLTATELSLPVAGRFCKL